MSRRRMVVAGTICSVLVAAGLVAAAPSASAGITGRQIVRATSPSGTQQMKSVRAFCPVGKRVISGGGDLSPHFTNDTTYKNVKILGLAPVHPATGQDYFEVTADARSGYATAWSVQAHAVCANPPPGYAVKFSTSAQNSTSHRAAVALCPVGTKAIGGGGWVYVPPPPALPNLRLSAYPETLMSVLPTFGEGNSAGSVVATAMEGGTGSTQSWQLAAYAVCATPPAGYLTTVGHGQPRAAAVSFCPGNTLMLGLGFILEDETHLVGLNPYDVGQGGQALANADADQLEDVGSRSTFGSVTCGT